MRAIQVQSLDEREEIFDDKLDSDGARTMIGLAMASEVRNDESPFG